MEKIRINKIGINCCLKNINKIKIIQNKTIPSTIKPFSKKHKKENLYRRIINFIDEIREKQNPTKHINTFY